MTTIAVRFVDVYVLCRRTEGWQVLALRRADGVRCTGAWETIHGRIESGETPVEAAVRELREETGLAPASLYNLSRIESFYLHRTDEVAMIPVFAAIIPDPSAVRLSPEHDRFEWLDPDGAARRFAWPRERRAVRDALDLLARGDAGPLEMVLRVDGQTDRRTGGQ